MELAREPAERLLDGRAVRVAADAQHVVVVPLHAVNQSSSYTLSDRRESSEAAERTDLIARS